MSSRYTKEDVKRKLYAESMGRCMNPSCNKDLFGENGDIIEKAHIDSYCETEDNSFENLVLLCPNCHTDFDKNQAFSKEEILGWKKKRREELEKFFKKKYDTFEELKKIVVPILLENKIIFENYYLKGNKKLWDKFEPTILVNNRKLKTLLSSNLDLIQRYPDKRFSNLAYIQLFIAHIDEFEGTRLDEEKSRQILFPPEINSMFGIAPMKESIIPSVEALELLIKKLEAQEKFKAIVMGIENPFIVMEEDDETVMISLDDTPRIRQLYYDYNCFKGAKIRLSSLNYALKYISSRNLNFNFINNSNLREIKIENTKMIFIYEYCLSKSKLIELSPEEGSVIVNLHNWNGVGCISEEAYEQAKYMNVTLLTMEAFYEYINKRRK